MYLAVFTLSVHESTDHLRPGRNDPGPPGRDSTQPRCSLRSSLARGVVGRTRHELPRNGQSAGRFAWDRGELGTPLRTVRVCQAERARRPRTASAFGARRDETGGGGATEEYGRLWPAGAALGRTAVVQLCAKAIRCDAAGAPVPANVPTPRFPFAQTSSRNCSSRPASAGGGKKNSSASPPGIKSICGRWTKSISNSMAAAVVCGSLPRFAIRYVVTRPRAKASATSARCGYVTDVWWSPSPKAVLMPRHAGPSCASCADAVGIEVGECSLSWTTSVYHHVVMHAKWR